VRGLRELVGSTWLQLEEGGGATPFPLKDLEVREFRSPPPLPKIRKIHVDSAALTHRPFLDLRPQSRGFAPILRPSFLVNSDRKSMLFLRWTISIWRNVRRPVLPESS
jgi:hypothetical protein